MSKCTFHLPPPSPSTLSSPSHAAKCVTVRALHTFTLCAFAFFGSQHVFIHRHTQTKMGTPFNTIIYDFNRHCFVVTFIPYVLCSCLPFYICLHHTQWNKNALNHRMPWHEQNFKINCIFFPRICNVCSFIKRIQK